MTLFRTAACVALLGVFTLVNAQTATPVEKSPEAKLAEDALRAQVQKFYDLLVAGKPRATESMVCEASKDAYYSMTKSKPRSAEVRSVKLSADLQSAQAVVLMEDEFPIGFENKVLKMPMPSNWKLEAGQWCYYLAPGGDEMDTPFGKMKLDRNGSGKPGDGFSAASLTAVNPSKLPAMVSFSKHALALPNEADGNDEIVISNGLNGPIQFRLACPDVPGLTCKLAQDNIPAGQKGKLLVDFTFKGTKLDDTAAVTLWVLPFDSATTFPIRRPPQKPTH